MHLSERGGKIPPPPRENEDKGRLEGGKPGGLLWGGRFQQGPAPTAQAFSSSLPFDFALYPYDIMGSMAHCRMLARQGIIAAAEAKQLLKGLLRVYRDLEKGTFGPDPRWEDIHSLVESRLWDHVGEVAGKLHTARSRNDQVSLDMRLFGRQALLDQAEALGALQTALVKLAANHAEAVMPGYTHLQRAQPVLFAHHLLAYFEMFDRDAQRLRSCFDRTNISTLGAGALAGVPYPIDPHYVAELLGFSSVFRNSIDGVSDRDFVVEQLADLCLIMAHLSRLAEEWVLWSASEFGFIEIGEAYTTGSSIMPQKKNPDLAELIRAKAGRVYGAHVAMLTVLKGLPLAYHRDLQEDKEMFFDAVATGLGCSRVAAEMVENTRPQPDRMLAAVSDGSILATDLADHLASKGMPFREAHQVVGRVVRWCVDKGRDIAALTLEELRGFSPLFGEEAVGLTPQTSAASRESTGGTAPARVKAAMEVATARSDELRQWVAATRQRLPDVTSLAAS